MAEASRLEASLSGAASPVKADAQTQDTGGGGSTGDRRSQGMLERC